MGKSPVGKIIIRFTPDGKAHFDIKTGAPSQLVIAMMGLEGHLHSITGLEAHEIRELIDEEKGVVNVKRTDKNEDAIDVEEVK